MPGAALIRSPLGIVRFLQEFWFSSLNPSLFVKRMRLNNCGLRWVYLAWSGYGLRWLGIPVFTHEANRAVGKAVRLIARYSKRLYLPDGIRVDGISSEVTRNVGYPLRHDFRRGSPCVQEKDLGSQIPSGYWSYLEVVRVLLH